MRRKSYTTSLPVVTNCAASVLWNLEEKYHTLPIADRIAWEAAENWPPSDCEGDEVCCFFVSEGEIRY